LTWTAESGVGHTVHFPFIHLYSDVYRLVLCKVKFTVVSCQCVISGCLPGTGQCHFMSLCAIYLLQLSQAFLSSLIGYRVNGAVHY